MDFQDMIFDVYYLSEKVQNLSNELSGLEFADERGYLTDPDRDRLKLYKEQLDEARKIASERLKAIREKHGDLFGRHLQAVTDLINSAYQDLEAQNDESSSYDRAILKDLLSNIRDIQQNRPPRYSIWWVFFYIGSVLRRNGEYTCSAASLKEGGNRIRPVCPFCLHENDITGNIDIFLPPALTPYEHISILDEYVCTGCHQRYRVMFRIYLQEPVTVEIINVDKPPAGMEW